MATTRRLLDFFDVPSKENELTDGDNKGDELYALCDDPMQTPIKLIDERLKFVNSSIIMDLLVENTGFLVVGVVGFQGSGKSSILNLLANHLSSDCTLFDGPYNTQTMQNIITNSPLTGGVDLYITQDRIILLDTQPLASLALTNYHIQFGNNLSPNSLNRPSLDGSSAVPSNGHRITMPGGWAPEVWSEMASIQLAAFLLNVCHVVIVASDHLDSSLVRLHRLIDCASGLRPTVYTPSVLANPIITMATPRAGDSSRQRKERKTKYSTVGQVNLAAATVQHQLPPGVLPNTITTTPRTKEMEKEDDEGVGYDDEDNDELQGSRSDNMVAAGDGTVEDDSNEDKLMTAPSGLLRNRRSQDQQLFDTEPSEVREAMSWLRGLIGYSASLIHVYNAAPAAAFLDPVVNKYQVDFHSHLLPKLYSWSRRLDYLIGIGPCLLSAHARRRSRTSQSHLNTSANGDRAASSLNTHNNVAHLSGIQMEEVLPIQPDLPSVADLMISDACGGNISPSLPAHSDTGGDTYSMSDCQSINSQEQEKKANWTESLPSDCQHRASAPPTSSDTSQSSQKHLSPNEIAEEISLQNQSANITVIDSSKIEDVLNSEAAPIRTNPSVPSVNQTGECQISPPVTTMNNPDSINLPSTRLKKIDVEKEIVAECCSVIQTVEDELHRQMRSLFTERPATVNGRSTAVDADERASSDGRSMGAVDGEEISARLDKMARHIHAVRQRFFNTQRRWDNVRSFLLPEVDENGGSPLGCPTYAALAKRLQDAVLSTPRQHMVPQMTEKKWFAYAQNMWTAVYNSPLLSDYHAFLLNQIH